MVAAVAPQPPTAPPLRTARDLARVYDAHVAARWRGDPVADAFFAWLAAYRCPAPPPVGLPAALSPHGAGGHGITWYDAPDAVLGHVGGAAWGYEIPREAEPPAPRPAPGRRSAVIGRLHPDELEAVLHRQHVGRLACLADGRPSVVPITYAYAGGDVYGHALPGRKLAALRADPHVCFEADEREDGETWCSVVAEGVYEEVADATERQAALALLQGTEPTVLPATAGAPGVVFRLHLTEKTGRFVRRVA